MTRWGKSGQRLSAAEARARDGKRRYDAWRAERSAELEERRGHEEWLAGHLIPDRITMALDSKGLDGPEVDEQCLAHEPEVDMWEAGTLYPTWEQTKALAELCGVTPRFLMVDGYEGRRISPHMASMRFHEKLPEPEPPVLRFTEDAIRDRLHPDEHAGVVELHPATLF